MKTPKKLSTAKEVMQAFLDGERLTNKHYRDSTGEMWLYLSEYGDICEEDGAGAKAHRCNHFDFRGEDPEWCTLCSYD